MRHAHAGKVTTEFLFLRPEDGGGWAWVPKYVKQRAKHVACKQGERPIRVWLEIDSVQMCS